MRTKCLGQVIEPFSVGQAPQALAVAKNGKRGGTDGTVVEMYKDLPVSLRLLTTVQFIWHALGGCGLARDEDFRTRELFGLAKEAVVPGVDDFRFVACSSVLCKWYLRLILLGLKERRASRGVLTLGCVIGVICSVGCDEHIRSCLAPLRVGSQDR